MFGALSQWVAEFRCRFLDGGHVFTMKGNCIYCGKIKEVYS